MICFGDIAMFVKKKKRKNQPQLNERGWGR